MKIDHIDHMWPMLLEEVLDNGHRADAKQDKIFEKIGAHIVLDGSAEQFLLNPRRKLSPIYASAELLWYLGYNYDASMICAYAPQYKQFCETDGTAFGAYGGRIADNIGNGWRYQGHQHNQLYVAIQMLKQRSSSKKCVVSMWRPSDLIDTIRGTAKDIPCTLTWQFIARGEQLHMVCSMRSNDLWKGFLYDCYINTVIQRYVAGALGMTAGEYHHIAGSMHLYQKDANKAQEAIACYYGQAGDVEKYIDEHYFHPSSTYWTDEELSRVLEAEQIARSGQTMANARPPFQQTLRDALVCCQAKWSQREFDGYDFIRAPGLRRGMEQFLNKEKTHGIG